MSVKHAQEFLRLAMKDEGMKKLLASFTMEEFKQAASMAQQYLIDEYAVSAASKEFSLYSRSTD